MRIFFLFFSLMIFLTSCQKEPKKIIDTSNIEVEFMINRFEIDFYESSDDNLQDIKQKYPALFPVGTPDSVWVAKINDSDERELYVESQKVYKDFSNTEIDLLNLFKHITYYHKNFKSPNVTTILSNIDYEYRIIYSDLFLFISLDAYLGKTHPFYNDFPGYIKENNTQERIVVDVANKIIETEIKPSNNRTFIAKLIHQGIRLYLLDLYLPSTPDATKIGYSKEKFDWALVNEEQVWKYFIENNLLYSTETKLNKRFLEDAPFSKFYLSEDSKSPGRIGERIGWQIVRSFMEKNDVSLQTLLSMDEEEIFKMSKYKPRK